MDKTVHNNKKNKIYLTINPLIHNVLQMLQDF